MMTSVAASIPAACSLTVAAVSTPSSTKGLIVSPAAAVLVAVAVVLVADDWRVD